MKSCILTVIKNEQEYLDEWIQYHLHLGINHIFIFEDIDSDSHEIITNKYNQVTLSSVQSLLTPNEQKHISDYKLNKKFNPQYLYIKKGLSFVKSINDYDWCFIIDNDEFLTLNNHNLNDILFLYNNYDAVILQCQCYGANGLIHKPDYSKNKVVDIFKKPMSGYMPTSTPMGYTKTCYNLNTYQNNYFWYIHQPSDACNFVKTNFQRERLAPVYDNIYIRHYITKSWEEYIWKIKTRGYFVGKIKNIDFFFAVNSDMLHLKEQLVNELKEEKLVILPFNQQSAQGNEIELALNAWKKFCKFKYHFVVIGEFYDELKFKFPWVEFINCKTLTQKQGQYTPNLDAQYRMRIAMNKYSKIYDGFIWMNDDFYAIKPFDFNDISTTYYHSSSFTGCLTSPTSFWNHTKWKTRQLLDKENLPHINYSIHYPYYLEFKKLIEIWDKFDMMHESYVLEDIYFNYFPHEKPILDNEIRLGIWNQDIFYNEFQKAIDNPKIKFMCNSVEGWSKELEEALKKVIYNE